MSDLKVCTKCGWYAHSRFSINRCDPVLGEHAAVLQAAIGDITSTKLGYGEHRVTFTIADGFAVGFDVGHPWNESGDALDVSSTVFRWRFLHCLDGLSNDDAADLVRTLRDWHARRIAREVSP